ncbi:MAG: hypothetical protein INH41_17565 [Myxococcaceae bacterium]|nr:hypothetical protein [Myxococcaceae bacterium]MCA3014193.1 hypothetical protein [Myxococcaceae bacterium]
MTAIRAGLAVLSALFAGGCLVLLVAALKTALRRRARARWPPARATITAVGWESRPENEGVLRVTFDVQGGAASTRLDVGDETYRDDQREALLARFAAGSTHEARLDPTGATPPELVTGLVQRPLVPLVLAGVFQVLSAVMAGLAWYLGEPGNLLARLLGG